jgi:hypothetical protein
MEALSGTHAFVATEADSCRVGEQILAARLLPRPRADELLTVDRDLLLPGRDEMPPFRPCSIVVADPARA